MPNEVVISTTSDLQSSVDEASAHDEAVGYGETPPASRASTTVTSSTDDVHDIESGARLYDSENTMFVSRDQRSVGRPIGPEPPAEAGVHIASSTMPPEQVEAERNEAVEEKQANAKDWLTKQPKRKFSDLVSQVSRLTDRNLELQAQNEQLRSQQSQQQYQPPQQSGDQSPQYQPLQSPEQQQQAALQEAQRQTQEAYRWAQQQMPTPVQQQQILQEFATARERVAAEEQEFVKTCPDYMESVKKLANDSPMPLPETARLHLVMHTESGPATAYFLSKNPEYVAGLNWLEAQGAGVRVIEEINKISHGLAFRGSAQQQRQAAASAAQRQSSPQPLRNIGGRGYTGTPDIRDPTCPTRSIARS